MKEILKNKIINIENTLLDDKKFLFRYLDWDKKAEDMEIIFMGDLLEKYKNLEILEKVKTKPAIWEQVYPRKIELKIFEELFENAIKNNKKIHIVGVTLKKEIEILEKYYYDLGFFREEINAFKVDFSKVLVSVSVNIENLIYRGSNYKAFKEKIFFNPPIRESGETKAMFKGINRGVIAGIFIKNFDSNIKNFLQEQIKQEHILAITMAKVLYYNLIDLKIIGEEKNLVVKY